MRGGRSHVVRRLGAAILYGAGRGGGHIVGGRGPEAERLGEREAGRRAAAPGRLRARCGVFLGACGGSWDGKLQGAAFQSELPRYFAIFKAFYLRRVGGGARPSAAVAASLLCVLR